MPMRHRTAIVAVARRLWLWFKNHAEEARNIVLIHASSVAITIKKLDGPAFREPQSALRCRMQIIAKLKRLLQKMRALKKG
jgi:hypothetical protein